LAQALRKSPVQHGFSDSSHFTRRFKTRFGVTPGSILNR
jgi:AraC-like DNA-binding protein